MNGKYGLYPYLVSKRMTQEAGNSTLASAAKVQMLTEFSHELSSRFHLLASGSHLGRPIQKLGSVMKQWQSPAHVSPSASLLKQRPKRPMTSSTPSLSTTVNSGVNVDGTTPCMRSRWPNQNGHLYRWSWWEHSQAICHQSGNKIILLDRAESS